MGYNVAIILAGGVGKRAGLEYPKQFMKIKGKSLLEITVRSFTEHNKIDSVILVVKEEYIDKAVKIVSENTIEKVRAVIPGGNTRQESSYIGLMETGNSDENILIHDAARPFVSEKLISGVLNKLSVSRAVIPVVNSTDTLVELSHEGSVKKILDKNKIKRVQTPQGFKREIIINAHKIAIGEKKYNFPDDSSLVINYNISGVTVINGEETNIKITTGSDLITAEKILKEIEDEEKMRMGSD